VDIVFQGLVGVLDVFRDYISYFDVVAWTYTLPRIFEEDNYDGYVELVAWTHMLPGIFVEEWSLSLQILNRQAEYPTSNKGNLRITAYGYDEVNRPIFLKNNGNSESNSTGMWSHPGRPVIGATTDTNFM
jgi:hypothetical protein